MEPAVRSTATEYVYYNISYGPWHQFDVKSAANQTDASGQSTTLDIRNFPVGTYYFWVHATADDVEYPPGQTGIDVYSDAVNIAPLSPAFINLT